MNQRDQTQMFYESTKNVSACDMLFLAFVEEGLTKQELQTNIDNRPDLWGKYAHWIDKLPSEPQVGDEVVVNDDSSGIDLAKCVVVVSKVGIHYIVEDYEGVRFDCTLNQFLE